MSLDALDLGVPLAVQLEDAGTVLGRGRVVADGGRKLLERRPRVTDERDRGVLEGVELADVDVDEPDARVLEGGLRRRREVREPGADADHEIGPAWMATVLDGLRHPGSARL